MFVTLLGMGCGTADTLTAEGQKALHQADAVIGAARLLENIDPDCHASQFPEVRADKIAGLLKNHGWKHPCVLYSGDTGFYSGVRTLLPFLNETGIAYRILPGIASVQAFSARLGRPWQDWNLCSAHGVNADPVRAVCQGRPAFFLTGVSRKSDCAGQSPAGLCRRLVQAGLGNLPVTVGECLGCPDERVRQVTAEKAAQMDFSPLSVLLVEAAPLPYPLRTPGIPDEAFVRGDIPMTKQEIRAAVLGKLAVRPADTVWDIGAGTGSVSVELASAARSGQVYAVERRETACALIRQNRERFGAWNLTLISGAAPEILEPLPAPDAVFIGGSGGKLQTIFDCVFRKNPAVRLCISAIALETLSCAVAELTARGLNPEITQISVSRTKNIHNLHLLFASNPVFLISI